ncbi:DUF4440 domain-containing protein [Qipengyuania mesophila]|uniref:DUF4440 domain-containing protein n=1 Tax=Qipengyuania mesophila TaxID=2867246 RepID=UPI0035153226
MSAILALALAQATVPAANAMPTGDALVQTVEANDAALFWGFFEGCDPDAVAALLHPDFRMVHDLVGLAHDSAADIVEDSRRNCARRAPGGEAEGYKNRRLFVPGSRHVQKLGDWGVLEEGHHTFLEYQRVAPGSEERHWVQTGGGRYIHTWQWMPEEGRFRLLESLSLDHGPAPAYPPEQAE